MAIADGAAEHGGRTNRYVRDTCPTGHQIDEMRGRAGHVWLTLTRARVGPPGATKLAGKDRTIGPGLREGHELLRDVGDGVQHARRRSAAWREDRSVARVVVDGGSSAESDSLPPEPPFPVAHQTESKSKIKRNTACCTAYCFSMGMEGNSTGIIGQVMRLLYCHDRHSIHRARVRLKGAEKLRRLGSCFT